MAEVNMEQVTIEAMEEVNMEQENAKLNVSGMAYDVILKPAIAENPPIVRSPLQERPITQELIQKKLKDAEERRQSMEALRLMSIAKDKERAAEASVRAQELNDSFVKEAEKKLAEKMESVQENAIRSKNAKIQALQERLKAHSQRVEDLKKMSDQYTTELRERIERKMETTGEKRDAQIGSIQERIREHQKHIEEVVDASTKFSKSTEEKHIQKMEASLKKREDQVNQLMDRLKAHENRAQKVRQNKLNQSSSEDSIDTENDPPMSPSVSSTTS